LGPARVEEWKNQEKESPAPSGNIVKGVFKRSEKKSLKDGSTFKKKEGDIVDVSRVEWRNIYHGKKSLGWGVETYNSHRTISEKL